MIWVLGLLWLFQVVFFVVYVLPGDRVKRVEVEIKEMEERVKLLEEELEGMVGGRVDKGFLKGEFDEIVEHLYKVNGRLKK